MSEPGVGPESETAMVDWLPTATADGRARADALRAVHFGAYQADSVVAYRSAGRVLILGTEEFALEVASRLKEQLRCVILTGAAESGRRSGKGAARDMDGVTLVRGKLLDITGYLGEFQARIDASGIEVDVGSAAGMAPGRFDMILDLSSPAFLQRDILPPGYFAPKDTGPALERALHEIPEMVGEFEKPKYFDYNPDICAHGASGVRGCTRCLEVCPTFAITSVGEKIAVDPHLCQGGGSCVTSCPSGAIRYIYPPVPDLLEGIRNLLRQYREAGGSHPWVMFHDREYGRRLIETIAERMPERIIPIEVEELGSVGMDTWLATLAYGANRVVLLTTAEVSPVVKHEIGRQLEYAGAILHGMGYSRDGVKSVSAEAGLLDDLTASLSGTEITPATFAAMPEKRTTIRLAVDHLYAYAPRPKRSAPLPVGAPYGEVRVDRAACTLCMACVSVCPASALLDGTDLPQLNFREENCVQCGLCDKACPEQAIQRAPRFTYDSELRQKPRILNEEHPFCCIVCGKPFATQSMMKRMAEKLKEHWMFQQPEAIKRLQMCEQCRVKDMFRQTGGLMDVHRRV